MKRFALATMLLAMMGLNIGCGPAPATDDAAPAADVPPVEGTDAEAADPAPEGEAEAEAPAE